MSEQVPPTKVSIWTDERLVLWLIKLHPDHSAKKIAAKLSKEFGFKISRNAVIGKLHRLGLTQKNKPKPSVTRGPSALRKPHTPRPANKSIFKIINSSHGYQRIVETTTAELPALTCVEVKSLNLTMAQLKSTNCRYISGHDGNWSYCGNDIFKRSFCAVHFQLAYRPYEARRVPA